MLKEYDRCRARHLDSEPLEKPPVGQPEGAVAVKVKANTCLLFGASDALFTRVRLLRSVANRASGAAVRSPLLALPDSVRTTKRPDFPFSIRNRNVLTRLRRWA